VNYLLDTNACIALINAGRALRHDATLVTANAGEFSRG
jgi:predicted nucleic acid-binding protein